jgi:hypothetical protein
LGLVNYYREFIQDLGKIGKPLYEVREEETLEWTPEMIAAFESLRALRAKLPFRVLWDPSKDLRIRTDASCDGLGIVLEQKEEKETWWPLAFYSHTWHPNEKNWPTYHQEMMAFMEALEMETLPPRPPHHDADRLEICRANQHTDGHS